MTPFYTDDWLTLYGGDARAVLAELPADSVDCVVTSPPYWGLRSYIGADDPNKVQELGLERTPEEYVANLVAVFAEVRRALKSSGTCWLNLGDSYNAYNGGAGPSSSISAGASTEQRPRLETGFGLRTKGLKPKDLVGIPWRVAFALQADGWYLRSDIIWSKPNPMPESVTDRPTKAHEYLFLLTKSARYYFDADAVREAMIQAPHAPGNKTDNGRLTSSMGHFEEPDRVWGNPAGRNIRSVWTIATRPYPGAHFAVFPPELPERCIKAGSSERGVCPECGAPWERVVERTRSAPTGYKERREAGIERVHESGKVIGNEGDPQRIPNEAGRSEQVITTGWRPTCVHQFTGIGSSAGHGTDMRSAEPAPAVILDPFAGSGTVGMVANRLSRRAILIDLNPEYLVQQMKRNAQTPLGLSA